MTTKPWWRKLLHEFGEAVGTEMVVVLIAILVAVVLGIIYFVAGGASRETTVVAGWLAPA